MLLTKRWLMENSPLRSSLTVKPLQGILLLIVPVPSSIRLVSFLHLAKNPSLFSQVLVKTSEVDEGSSHS